MWARVLTAIPLVFSSIFTNLPTPESSGLKRSVVSERFGASLRIVENSGICETTPGVHTVSGYIDTGNNANYFFWFFSSRQNVNASSSPLVLWLNGEHGPCRVNLDKKSTTINHNSWNEAANVLYIDQPIGSGFSHGTQNADSSEKAASTVWIMLQTFFETFPTYQGRELILATESYGGHYGPEFVSYFDAQNIEIRHGRISGETIIVSALMINNGWIHPAVQYLNYPGFAANPPGYDPIVSDSVVTKATSYLLKDGGCMDQIKACNAGGSNKVCYNAFNYCPWYINYLQQKKIQQAIGAEVKYSQCNNGVFDKFTKEGDFTRTLLPKLGDLANSGLKILIWYGDADYICNWSGGLALTLDMEWYGKARFGNAPFVDITISQNGIGRVGQGANVDNFSFVRVFKSGHEVPFYQPEASLAFLKQVIAKEPIHSV
ncbi:hypothetical protein FRB97_005636 [Tulasnella sp. 331]|nr:hypothetical protein FRB97_005636 [Tulasnella sp. 331]